MYCLQHLASSDLDAELRYVSKTGQNEGQVPGPFTGDDVAEGAIMRYPSSERHDHHLLEIENQQPLVSLVPVCPSVEIRD